MNSYLRLIGFLSKAKRDTMIKILIGLFISVTYVCQAYSIARGIALTFNACGYKRILVFIVVALAAVVVRSFLVRLSEGHTKYLAAKVKGEIRNCLIDKLMQLGIPYQNDKRSGNVQSLVTDGVESFEAFLTGYVPQAVLVLSTVAALVIYIVQLDALVGAIVFVAALLSVLIPHFLMPMVSKVMIEYWQAYALLNAQYIDAMQGMSTLKAFHASRKKSRELSGNVHDFARESINNLGVSLADSAVIVLLTAIGASVSVGVAAVHTAAGTLSIAGLLTILFLVVECMRPLFELNMHWHASYLGLSVAEQFFGVLDERVTVTEKKGAARIDIGENIPSVEFRDVSFRYTQGATDALRNVSLCIEPGQTVAVVGRSGSGKSTMVNLLLRFYDANHGTVSIGGRDVREISIDSLRSNIAVVFQDTYLFYGTVEENLRMAKPDATEPELRSAARAANAHEFIEKLPQGYQTLVGERGATLSGGERQRIAIARAILKDAPLLLLDEATSSVDAASEAAISDALQRLAQNRTTIIIAHRLSTVEHVDTIFVLDNGELCEQGTHPQLMGKSGVYAALIRAQQKARGKQ